MKLKRFTIENYKALGHLDVCMDEDLLFLIGVNGAGKSSVLQALSLVRYFSEGATSAFFKDRDWKPTEARPKTTTVRGLRPAASRSRPKPPNLAITLGFDYDGVSVLWSFEWDYLDERTIAESVWVWNSANRRPRKIFALSENPDDTDEAEDDEFQRSIRFLSSGEFELPGSILAVLRTRKIMARSRDREILEQLRAWAGGITLIDRLIPSSMRNIADVASKDIGAQGQHLPAFIANLPSAAKNRVVDRVSDFYGIDGIDTVRKRSAWVDMRVAESFKLMGRVGIEHMSDGFLRILALCAIPEFGRDIGLVLLDEVEDGIEPHILPSLIERVASESRAQLVMTSHSPLLINFFDQDQIYMLGRAVSGHSIGARASSLAPFRQGEDYFGSGEIWANADISVLGTALRRVRTPRRTISDAPTSREIMRYLGSE